MEWFVALPAGPSLISQLRTPEFVPCGTLEASTLQCSERCKQGRCCQPCSSRDTLCMTSCHCTFLGSSGSAIFQKCSALILMRLFVLFALQSICSPVYTHRERGKSMQNNLIILLSSIMEWMNFLILPYYFAWNYQDEWCSWVIAVFETNTSVCVDSTFGNLELFPPLLLCFSPFHTGENAFSKQSAFIKCIVAILLCCD